MLEHQLSDVGQSLGRAVSTVDESLVGELVVRFARDNAEVLGIDTSQLGTPRVTQVTEHLWQVHIPQQIQGIPVREGRLAATLSHGNLVLIGTEGWADVKIRTLPLVAADQALERGLARAGLAHSPKSIWKDANLEVVPVPTDLVVPGFPRGRKPLNDWRFPALVFSGASRMSFSSTDPWLGNWPRSAVELAMVQQVPGAVLWR
ncbi:hypothetical protein [Archangium violaceum]|uniref:hypothetical protein n=1 Tax=Archangium violaceum TaxID=83451 RepID=UPI000695FF71|nr:hypothetical protein [Archangium violaceum]